MSAGQRRSPEAARNALREVRVWGCAHDATSRSSGWVSRIGFSTPAEVGKPSAPKLHSEQRTRDMAVVNRVIDGLHKCDLVVLRAVVAPDGYTVGRQPLAIAPQREDIHSAQVQRVSARAPENAYASGVQCRYRGRTTRPCVPAYTRGA